MELRESCVVEEKGGSPGEFEGGSADGTDKTKKHCIRV